MILWADRRLLLTHILPGTDPTAAAEAAHGLLAGWIERAGGRIEEDCKVILPTMRGPSGSRATEGRQCVH
jgi:hypothetical protein